MSQNHNRPCGFARGVFRARSQAIDTRAKPYTIRIMDLTWTPDRIRAFRQQHGYTQTEFAQLCGVSQQTVERWEAPETAARHLPANESHRRLLTCLELMPDQLRRRLYATVKRQCVE